MLLFAVLDGMKSVLEWVDAYGADKVFMVLFMFMWLRSEKKSTHIQDARLVDSKEAIQALIESKHAFEALTQDIEEYNETLTKIMDKLDD